MKIVKLLLSILLLMIYLQSTGQTREIETMVPLERENRLNELAIEVEKAYSKKDFELEMRNLVEMIRLLGYDREDEIFELALRLDTRRHEYPNLKASEEVCAFVNYTFGSIYQHQEAFESAKKAYEEAYQCALKNDYYFNGNYIQLRIAELMKVNHNNEALKIYEKLMNEAIENKDTLEISKTNEFIVDYFVWNDSLEKALSIALENLTYEVEGRSPVNRNIQVANIYRLLGKPEEALPYALKALESEKNVRMEAWVNFVLKEVYTSLGKFEDAYFHLAKVYDIESADNEVQTGIRELSFSTERERLRLEQELAKTQRDYQRVLNIITGSIVVILSILFVFIWSRMNLIRKQKEQIEEEKRKAEQSEKYKEQFLANVSHEIRTPLHGIIGIVETLQRQNHLKGQDSYLNALAQSSDNLLFLINDILDLSKIESGKIEIQKIPLEVRKVVDEVIFVLSVNAADKGMTIKKEIGDNVPPFVEGDPHRLTQILFNIIGNAIKFSNSGEIIIKVIRNYNAIQYSVKDEGPGIPESQKTLIFESFRQGNTKGIKGQRGTGLGLTISKELINIQSGKIWVQSAIGVGSTFFFELPLKIVEPVLEDANPGDQTLKDMGEALAGISILIADDNEFNLMLASDELQWYIPDVKITNTTNGTDALEAFGKNRFDIVLLDIQMPEMDGYEVAHHIRKSESKAPHSTRIPIIGMTAGLFKNENNNSKPSALDHIISKPYKAEQLIKVIYKSIIRVINPA